MMSKKEKLLTENQVRQFMKLANLQPLTPGFVNGLSEAHPDWGTGKDEKSRARRGDDDEDEVKESHGRGRGESDAGHGTNDPRDQTRPGARLREEEGYDEFEEENVEDSLEPAEDLEVDAPEDLGDVGLEPEVELEMGAVKEGPALQEMISTITKRVAKRIVKEALQKKK